MSSPISVFCVPEITFSFLIGQATKRVLALLDKQSFLEDNPYYHWLKLWIKSLGTKHPPLQTKVIYSTGSKD
jgi:hypothetical protein